MHANKKKSGISDSLHTETYTVTVYSHSQQLTVNGWQSTVDSELRFIHTTRNNTPTKNIKMWFTKKEMKNIIIVSLVVS